MFKLLKNIKVYRSGAWRDTNLLIAGPSIALLDDALTLSIPGLGVIDGQGMYALPGYVDRHVHITGGGGEGGFSNAVAPLRVEALVRAQRGKSLRQGDGARGRGHQRALSDGFL